MTSFPWEAGLLLMLLCELFLRHNLKVREADSQCSSVYFTISMQYTGGPNYLSQFLSFINSTVRLPLPSLNRVRS